jgi:hypothetical protein
MNLIDVQNRIVKAFDQFWTYTPIEHQNTTLDKDSLDEWIRLTIQHGQPKPIDFKMNAIRYGTASVQVFTKSDIGQGRACDLAVIAGQYIKALSTGSLVFSPYEVVVLGNKATPGLTTTETDWFQVNVMIDFTFID